MNFLSCLIGGIKLGSVFAIIALGYTMVYGIAKMLNFAHGDIIMVGGFVSYTAMTSFGAHPIIAVIIAMIFCTVLGIVIEGIAYRPLRNAASSLAVLITAIGVSYFLQNAALLIFGATPVTYTSIAKLLNIQPITVGGVHIDSETIITVITCIVIMVGLTLFINKTKPGRAMLAVSEDKDTAQLMGVNVNRTISLTFAIGAGLAAVAGVLLCSSYNILQNTTGAMPGIKAFVAAVLGGIGSVPGAMVGGILLGIIEIMAKAYVSSEVADAIVFGVLIVVLLIKPTGIFGKKMNEKV